MELVIGIESTIGASVVYERADGLGNSHLYLRLTQRQLQGYTHGMSPIVSSIIMQTRHYEAICAKPMKRSGLRWWCVGLSPETSPCPLPQPYSQAIII
jgi:hypothetical protein